MRRRHRAAIQLWLQSLADELQNWSLRNQSSRRQMLICLDEALAQFEGFLRPAADMSDFRDVRAHASSENGTGQNAIPTESWIYV
jgi:hypothetical protein